MSPRTIEQNEQLKATRRLEIQEAALELFATQGFYNSSVSNVAKKAGVSKGLIYNYFSSKEEMLEVILQNFISLTAEKLRFDNPKKVRPSDVRRFVEASIDLVRHNKQQWKLFSSLFYQSGVMALVEEYIARLYKLTTEPLLAFYTWQGLRKEQAIIKAQLFHSALDGLKMKVLFADDEEFPIEQLKTELFETFTRFNLN